MPSELARVAASAAAVNRTVDGLDAEQLAAPSLLPGWSRAHVVAHLVLNGEALTGVLTAVLHDEPVAMYESDERRDAEIEALAAGDPSQLRDRLLAATTTFADAAELMDEVTWQGSFVRTPGAEPILAGEIPEMRWCELEIHHADLGTSYSCSDWPSDFALELVDRTAPDRASDGPFVLRATDLDRTWEVGGAGGPTISGTVAALGWWLTGRGSGEGLSCEGAALPTLSSWRRASATTVPTPAR